jgi:hypothetical protein
MREFIDDLGLSLKGVGRKFGFLLGIAGLTIVRFWRPIVGKELPNWLFWVSVGTCLLLAFFYAWRDEHRSRKKAESFHLTDAEKELMGLVLEVHEQLLELLWKWPQSPCVLTPFSISWRPLVGTTNIGEDVRATMEWHKRALAVVEKARALHVDFFREVTEAAPFPKPGIQVVDCMGRFLEVEKKLLTRII